MIKIVNSLSRCCSSCQKINETVKTFDFRPEGNASGSAIMLCDECREKLQRLLSELDRDDIYYEVVDYKSLALRAIAKYHSFERALARALELGAANYCVVQVHKHGLFETCTYYDHFSSEFLQNDKFTRRTGDGKKLSFED